MCCIRNDSEIYVTTKAGLDKTDILHFGAVACMLFFFL
jgi:hypothetical protein